MQEILSFSGETSDLSVQPVGLAQRVDVLEDLAALRKLKSLYAFSVDRCFNQPSRANAVATADLFTEDAVADYGILGRYAGRAQLLNGFENVFPAIATFTTHYITNPVLEVSGAKARGQWYFLVFVVFRGAPPGPPQNVWGHYTESYVNTSAGWKLQNLVAEYFIPPPPVGT